MNPALQFRCTHDDHIRVEQDMRGEQVVNSNLWSD
jgi:hypothetical protein